MKKHSFHLVPKTFFGFFLIMESDTSHVGPLAHTLGQAFSVSVQAERYGTGVKSITTTLILTDPEGLGRAHKVKRPKYSAGVQTIKAHGITVSTEDALEFGFRSAFVDVRNARNESEVAAALLSSIDQVKAAFQKLAIPDFDKDRFLAAFESFLEHAKTRGAYIH